MLTKLEDLASSSTAVFLISTHYEGEPTDDFKTLFKQLSKEKDKELFKGVNYTGFALGDLNYKYYCRVGREVNAKLSDLGGNRIFPFGEGSNDKGEIDEMFEEWSIPLFPQILPLLRPLEGKDLSDFGDGQEDGLVVALGGAEETDLAGIDANSCEPDFAVIEQ